MFDVPLYRRIVNRRGILLLSSFCIFGLALIMMTLLKYSSANSAGYFDILQVIFVVATLVTPTISLLKSGFSYKGHPGRRHLSLLLSGILMILLSFVTMITNRTRYWNDFTRDQLEVLLVCLLIPLHGCHSIVIYSSYFKGPTSKFGKIYQPYLPVIE